MSNVILSFSVLDEQGKHVAGNSFTLTTEQLEAYLGGPEITLLTAECERLRAYTKDYEALRLCMVETSDKNAKLEALLKEIQDKPETDNSHANGKKFDHEDRAYYEGLRVCAAIAKRRHE